MKEYNFVDAQSDIRAAILLIGLHGPNLVGMELGVFRGESFCTILQNCPNVKKLYGIDSWEPYTDWIAKEPFSRSLAQMEGHEWAAKHHVKWSGEKHRAKLLKGNTENLHSNFDDETFDFIFFDAYVNFDQVKRELHDWYPKIKKGGLCIGHDYNTKEVAIAVAEFRDEHNIDSYMTVYDETFAFKK